MVASRRTRCPAGGIATERALMGRTKMAGLESLGPPRCPDRDLWPVGRQGARPDLSRFLTAAGPLPTAQLAAVLTVDPNERWQCGDRVIAETYLSNHPAVGAGPELAVELIYGEFLLRE